jgi:putative sugar O-methyltransferase
MTKKCWDKAVSEQIEALVNSPTMYKPTLFWEPLKIRILNDIKEYGIENFKAFSSSLAAFVGRYGPPANGFSEASIDEVCEVAKRGGLSGNNLKMLQSFISGRMSAIADYRVLRAGIIGNQTNRWLELEEFSESDCGGLKEQFEFDSKVHSRNSLNYMLMLQFFQRIVGQNVAPKSVVEVGGGWGVLGEIIGKCSKQAPHRTRYIDFDIPPVSTIAEYYLQKVFGKDRCCVFSDLDESEFFVDDLPEFTVQPAWRIENLTGEVDMFVNSISFQEMEPEIIRNYLGHARRLNARYLLLRNIREGKKTKRQDPCSEFVVSEPVTTEFYVRECKQLRYKAISQNVIPYGRKTADGFHSEISIFIDDS